MEEKLKLLKAIDEALDENIRDFRDCVRGDEMRVLLSTYQELMLKRSKLVTEIAMESREAWNQYRKAGQ